ncbi:MAG: DUF4179 domain-containing protein [Eubacteriales bacterium]|nr:DUF4179 domain-containing protein [Eubacteriales bacterium]
MKENIYNLLNDIDHHIEKYNSFPADPADVKKWKGKMFFHKRAKQGWMKYAAAAAFICIAGIAVSPVRYEVYAQVGAAVYNLARLLGIQKDLSPYSTVVGETIERNGVSVTLNDVILDDESLLISYMVRSDKKMDSAETEMALHPDILLSIDGVMMQIGASGSSEKVEENSIAGSETIEVPGIDVQKQMDMKLDFWVNGRKIGDMAFEATGAELMANTKTVEISRSFTLPDGSEVTLERYTTSDINQKVYLSTAAERLHYDLKLKGADDLGHEVEFNMRIFADGRGRMEVSTIDNGFVNENAKELYLTLYAVEFPEESGRMSNDFQPVGEEFTITLPEK